MKTLKNKHSYYKAICVFHNNESKLNGIVKFTQRKGSKNVRVEYEIKGLKTESMDSIFMNTET